MTSWIIYPVIENVIQTLLDSLTDHRFTLLNLISIEQKINLWLINSSMQTRPNKCPCCMFGSCEFFSSDDQVACKSSITWEKRLAHNAECACMVCGVLMLMLQHLVRCPSSSSMFYSPSQCPAMPQALFMITCKQCHKTTLKHTNILQKQIDFNCHLFPSGITFLLYDFSLFFSSSISFDSRFVFLCFCTSAIVLSSLIVFVLFHITKPDRVVDQ